MQENLDRGLYLDHLIEVVHPSHLYLDNTKVSFKHDVNSKGGDVTKVLVKIPQLRNEEKDLELVYAHLIVNKNQSLYFHSSLTFVLITFNFYKLICFFN